MAGLAEDRSADRRIRHPVRAGNPGGVHAAGHDDRSRAAGQASLLLDVKRREPPVEADRQLPARLPDRPLDHPAFVPRKGHRLLDEHVLAGLERSDSLRSVMLVPAQYEDHVDVAILEQLVVIRAAVARAEALRVAQTPRAT